MKNMSKKMLETKTTIFTFHRGLEALTIQLERLKQYLPVTEGGKQAQQQAIEMLAQKRKKLDEDIATFEERLDIETIAFLTEEDTELASDDEIQAARGRGVALED